VNKNFNTMELLSHLKGLGVELWTESGKLRIDAPKGVLTAPLLEKLAERKTEILQFLSDATSSKSHDLMPILPLPRDAALCASFSQERLWFLSQIEPDNLAYNIAGGCRLKGRLRVDILEQGLSEIVRRHEALRTTFKEFDGMPMQVISPAGAFILALVDLQGFSETERSKRAEAIGIEEARRPFDLSVGPLFRAVLVRLGEQEHVLYFTMHHIVTDGWSFGIFTRELGALYKAFSEGQPSPLAELSIQYADFAHWQREWLQGEVLETQLEYWKKQLGGELPTLQLPADRPRPAVQTHRGSVQSFDLPVSLAEKLKDLSQGHGTTLFMTLLAAFKALLFRYTGQTNFAVGSPIANRTRTELEGLIGFFVNTLVLRTDLSGDPRFVEFLGKVRDTALEAFAHQETPFEKLVEALNPARDMSYSPLFQVMFVFQNAPRATLELHSLTLTPVAIDAGGSTFDLTLYMREEQRGLTGRFEYNTDLFDAETIKRMAGHFRIILESIVVDPNRRLSELPILTEVERHQLLLEWNATEKDYPKDKTLVHLFEEQVDQSPEATAVVFGDKRLSYRELNRRANQLAHHLQSLGVGPGSRVGIWMERSLDLMVSLVGTLKAGGAYVPLDPNYPQDRLSFMLGDAQVPVLLTREMFIKDLPEYAGHVVCMDRDGEAISRESEENPVSRIGPNDAVYVIYTSGSTGTPKGVIGLHCGAVNRLNWMWRVYPFKGGEVCCQKTYLSFVDSVWEIFGPLLQGVQTVIISDDAVKDPQLLIEGLAANHVSRIVLVPSLLRLLLDSFGDLQKRLPDLRLWVTSGEEIPVELAKRFGQAMPEARLINLYGSSEVSADVTFYEIGGDPQEKRVPIGRPIDNTQVHLLDENLQLVPVGVHGELNVGGAGLARGYLNRPDLTAERYIANPFRQGEVLFKTGDLGRRLADGSIEYLGRRDHQVKIRGFRVELGEVESQIKGLEAVSNCVAVLREDRPGDQWLVAYYVPREGDTVSGSHVRRHLESKLPGYMVPQYFVELSLIPLTPNGKVDRKALPKPQAEDNLAISFVAPNDSLEMQLTKIWESVLSVKPIGIMDNFFEIGGHSLLAARIFSRIEKTMGLNLPLVTLFQAPTVELLAKIIRGKSWNAGWSSLVPIQAGGSKPPLFFVHGAGGNVLLYRELALHLGNDQPFYGLQAQGLDGRKPPYTSFEDMATHYVKEVRSLQPEGPYYLGGYCLGGAIALEMAQQLVSQRHEVALLAMVETYNFSSAPAVLPFYYSRRLQNLMFHWQNLWTLPMRDKLAFFSKKSRTELERAKLKLIIALSRLAQKLKWSTHEKYPHIDLAKANDKAHFNYVPKSYNGQITLFRPKEHFVGRNQYDFGWGEVAQKGVEVRILQVYPRGSLVEPFVRELARQLENCIERTLK
jgi:amino acid adenylation domain-containing protein